MSDIPTNGNSYRLAAIERRLDRIESLEPAVVKQQIDDVRGELRSVSEEIGSLRKMLLGFIATFALSSITVIVSIATILIGRR